MRPTIQPPAHWLSITSLRRSATLAILGVTLSSLGGCKDVSGPGDLSQAGAMPQAGSAQVKPSSVRPPALLPQRTAGDRVGLR